MTGDLQLFMLWNNGRRLEKQILADIGSRYEIAGICEVFWPPRHFARNLARFYGKNLAQRQQKKSENAEPDLFLSSLSATRRRNIMTAKTSI